MPTSLPGAPGSTLPGESWPAVARGDQTVICLVKPGAGHQGLGVPFPKICVWSCLAVRPVPQTAGGSLPLTAVQFVHAISE